LQFVVFSERGEDEEYAGRPEIAPASAQGVGGSPARSRYAFTGKRNAPSGTIQETGGKGEDIQIDFIPDGDAPVNESRSEKTRQKKAVIFPMMNVVRVDNPGLPFRRSFVDKRH
jgi:hypothetical protein